tara:strand:+ start:124 stop:1257 length:1134 start_codon:yes stop_codon:yes gene_type:complete
MSYNYRSVIPENIKDTYEQYDQVDFVCTFEGQAINLNSVRLEGKVNVTQDGAELNTVTNNIKDIKLDRFVGAHSFIESVQTQISGNMVENITNYGRYVKMTTSATHGQGDMCNASAVCELKAPTERMSNMVLKGVVPETAPPSLGVNALRVDPDFSFKPLIALNSGVGSALPYSKSGVIRLSFNLARVGAALYGVDVNANTLYTLSDLKLSYSTIPETPEMKDQKIVMNTKLCISQSIQTQLASISIKVPSVVNAVSCSFLAQGSENSLKDNTLGLEKVPNLNQLQFMFNDSTNSYISFLLRDNVEIVGRYLDSFYDSPRNAMTINNLANNDGYGVGLDFDDFVDLRNQKFNLQIDSAISNLNPMVVYMYFHSIISV